VAAPASPARRDLLTLRLGRAPGGAAAGGTLSDELADADASAIGGERGPDQPEQQGHWIRVYRGAMACRFEVTLSGEDAQHIAAARDALREADRLEAALTVFRETSDLMRVNRTACDAPAEVDAELFDLLTRCQRLHADTDGAFDITSTPLSRCWGFLDRRGRVPTAAALDAARACVGMAHLHLDEPGRTVRFARAGMELNVGSIGKGYAVQQIGERLRANGVRHALVSAGGSSVLAIGGHDDGWSIYLRGRGDGALPLARLWLRDGALGTSGAGEQFVEADGRRYGHVLDPRTGWPAAGLLSVSVITRDAGDADALATAFFVGGLDLARRYCAAHPGTLALVTEDTDPRRPHVIGRYDGALVEAAHRESHA
jgi:thiamine biosynthesis lipoprotein